MPRKSPSGSAGVISRSEETYVGDWEEVCPSSKKVAENNSTRPDVNNRLLLSYEDLIERSYSGGVNFNAYYPYLSVYKSETDNYFVGEQSFSTDEHFASLPSLGEAESLGQNNLRYFITFHVTDTEGQSYAHTFPNKSKIYISGPKQGASKKRYRYPIYYLNAG